MEVVLVSLGWGKFFWKKKDIDKLGRGEGLGGLGGKGVLVVYVILV